MTDSSKYDRYFWFFILGVTAVRLVMATFLYPAPQETYYWNYARHPDLSYFDHPPMTAYFIKFFTSIFGSTAFGIHFSAIFISFLLACVIYFFTHRIFDSRTAFWSVVVGSTTFLFALGGLIITPDSPMLLFWFLSLGFFYYAVKTNSLQNWFLAGIFGGACFLSKYPAGLLLIGAAVFLIFTPKFRKLLFRPGPYVALAVSAIVSLPVFIWNLRHDWASFGFQSSRRLGGALHINWDYFFGFLGSQLGVLAIFLAPLFVGGLVIMFRSRSDDRFSLTFWFAVTPVLIFGAVSPFHYVKMNWLAPAYITALPAIVYLILNANSKALRNYSKFALAFSIVFTIIVHVAVLLPGIGFGKADTINGWDDLASEIDKLRPELGMQGDYFICGFDYKTAAQLSFHLEGQPELCSANIVGRKGLAYDYWCDPDTLIGDNCIFVYDQRYKYSGDLTDFFEQVEEPLKVTAEHGGKRITDFYVYKCFNYKGMP